jgi:hypothetical protein
MSAGMAIDPDQEYTWQTNRLKILDLWWKVAIHQLIRQSTFSKLSERIDIGVIVIKFHVFTDQSV